MESANWIAGEQINIIVTQRDQVQDAAKDGKEWRYDDGCGQSKSHYWRSIVALHHLTNDKEARYYTRYREDWNEQGVGNIQSAEEKEHEKRSCVGEHNHVQTGRSTYLRIHT